MNKKYSIELYFYNENICSRENVHCLWMNEDYYYLYFIDSDYLSTNEYMLEMSFNMLKTFLEEL